MRRRILIPAGVLLGLALLAAVWVAREVRAPYRAFSEDGVFVDIRRGAPLREVAAQLARAGVVRRAALVEWQFRLRGGTPQAGEYRFAEPVTPLEVYRALAEGRIYRQPVLVREGLTMWETAEAIAQEGFATREEFLAAAADATLIADLAPGATNLEGYLYPATYEFPRHTPADEIVAAMVRRFRQVWQQVAAEREPPLGLAPHEVVTLASLIERETGRADERPLIAGVFVNRLRRGIALQCDPTVVYALELAGRWRGQLLLRDLRFDHPYNTYRHRGLPPGPIASPGRAALTAALEPAEVDYLYFVSDARGGHWFSATLAEHNRNVARYRQQLAEDAAAERNRSAGQGEP